MGSTKVLLVGEGHGWKNSTLIQKGEGSKNWYTWLLDASEEHNSN